MSEPRRTLAPVPTETETKTSQLDIDPTEELSPEKRALLDELLLIEEKKHGEKGIFKRKI